MTPFGYRLQTEMNNEFSRMASEWFFPWHALSTGAAMDVDNFDGRRISYEGIAFSGTAELVYWGAVRRYISNKINQVFERAETEIRDTGVENAEAIARDAAVLLNSFCGRLVSHAVDTDRRLKGKGFPDTSYSSPYATRIQFVDETEQRMKALTDFYTPRQQFALRPEILTVKPSMWGVSFDLKEAGRQVLRWWRSRRM